MAGVPDQEAQSRGKTEKPKLRASDVQIYLQPIAEREKLELAKWLLLGIAILFLLGGLGLLLADENGQKLFDAVAAILPPIATLVIGYYFGEKSK